MDKLLKATQQEREELNELPKGFSNVINLVGPYPLIRDTEIYKNVGRDNRGNNVK